VGVSRRRDALPLAGSLLRSSEVLLVLFWFCLLGISDPRLSRAAPERPARRWSGPALLLQCRLHRATGPERGRALSSTHKAYDRTSMELKRDTKVGPWVGQEGRTHARPLRTGKRVHRPTSNVDSPTRTTYASAPPISALQMAVPGCDGAQRPGSSQRPCAGACASYACWHHCTIMRVSIARASRKHGGLRASENIKSR